jgi:hypothetical protein
MPHCCRRGHYWVAIYCCMLASVLHVHNAVGECKAVARWLELFIAEVPLHDVCHLAGTRVLSKYACEQNRW